MVPCSPPHTTHRTQTIQPNLHNLFTHPASSQAGSSVTPWGPTQSHPTLPPFPLRDERPLPTMPDITNARGLILASEPLLAPAAPASLLPLGRQRRAEARQCSMVLLRAVRRYSAALCGTHCLATLCRGPGLRHYARREPHGMWLCPTLQWGGPAPQRPNDQMTRDQMTRCSTMRRIGLGLRCCTRRHRMHCCCAETAPLTSTGGGRKSTTCALRRSGVESLANAWIP